MNSSRPPSRLCLTASRICFRSNGLLMNPAAPLSHCQPERRAGRSQLPPGSGGRAQSAAGRLRRDGVRDGGGDVHGGVPRLARGEFPGRARRAAHADLAGSRPALARALAALLRPSCGCDRSANRPAPWSPWETWRRSSTTTPNRRNVWRRSTYSPRRPPRANGCCACGNCRTCSCCEDST